MSDRRAMQPTGRNRAAAPGRPPALTLVLIPALLALALALGACGNDEEEGSAGDPDAVVSTTIDPSGDTTIPDLPVNDDPSAVVCTGDPQGTLDATELVGLSLTDAEAAAAEPGCSVREVVRDGEALAVTEDFRPDRVNVATEDGDVIEIVNLG